MMHFRFSAWAGALATATIALGSGCGSGSDSPRPIASAGTPTDAPGGATSGTGGAGGDAPEDAGSRPSGGHGGGSQLEPRAGAGGPDQPAADAGRAGSSGVIQGTGGNGRGGDGGDSGSEGDGDSGSGGSPRAEAGSSGGGVAGGGGYGVAPGGTAGAPGGTAGAAGREEPAGPVQCGDAPVWVDCTDLVEPALGTWTAQDSDAEEATTDISWIDDGAGGQLLRVDTNAAFELTVRMALSEPVDASSADELRVSVRALNQSPSGWQIGGEITIEDAAGARTTFARAGTVFPVDGSAWHALSVPVQGGAGWTRSGQDFDSARVAAIEFKLDTWDSGFRVDFDALSLEAAATECTGSCPNSCSGHGLCFTTSVCECDLGYAGDDCSACATGFVSTEGVCQLANEGDYDYWPNPVSSANSDRWLVVHHRAIRLVQPKLLVLNFVNPSDPDQVEALVDDVIAAMAEGSRFHGYEDETAEPQLVYERYPIVDLRDGVGGRPAPPSGYEYENSTLYPRRPSGESGVWRFDYAELFTDEFAPYLGLEDAASPGGYADLCTAVEQGLVNELWLVGSGDVASDVNGAEVLDAKPIYTSSGNITDAVTRCAGNGCYDSDVPFCGRSLRIGFVNYNRGPGCFLESEGHGMEGLANTNAIPALREWFYPFAALDLDEKYGTPFTSFYGRCGEDPDCIRYPTPTSVSVPYEGGRTEISDFDAVCGNVHFAPNARDDYDHSNTAAVLTSCRAFGTGPLCEADPTSTVSSSDWSGYESIAPDCQGPFLVWWYQNMPGYGTGQHFADGRPMPSMWPFLFY